MWDSEHKGSAESLTVGTRYLRDCLHRIKKLKLIDRLHATRWTPPDYQQRQFQWTGNGHSQLRWTRQAESLYRPAPHHWFKQFSLFDLDFCPTTFTFNHRLAKIKVDPHAKNQGQRSSGSNRRAPTDKRTDTHTHTHGRYQTYYLPCCTVDKNHWSKGLLENSSETKPNNDRRTA